MSYSSFSRIETIGSGFTDTESVASSFGVNMIQSDARRVDFEREENESMVPGEGFLFTLGAIGSDRYHNTKQAFRASCWGKIKSFFMCITIPLYVLLKPFVDSRPTRRKVTHHGIVYFYILMACTIVFNLYEQRNHLEYYTLSYKFLQYFEAGLMILVLIFMLYIACATRDDCVRWHDQERNLILYFRAGLYIFGVSSMVYTALNVYNYCNCKDVLNIIVNIAKFLFIAGQMLFLNYFYRAKLLSGGCLIQISLAHLVGTNLSLWIWTLCKEVHDSKNKNLDHCSPINLSNTEKYFYPLFVEYLLLAASMLYELWRDIEIPQRQLARRDWVYAKYQEEIEKTTSVTSRQHAGAGVIRPRRRTRKFAPSLAFSFVLGLAFSSIFFAFMLASNDSSGKPGDNIWYRYFVIANICFYCSQIFACYVLKICGQSQPADSKRSSLNLDDILLYFGLAGIVTWEGFHFYGLLFESNRQVIYFVHGLLGLFEDIVQTIILVSIRRLASREDSNSRTITSMSLFLLATNLCFWIQNSFYIEQDLQNPGESRKNLEEHLRTFAYILNPIIIFFRFHSATCCYQMWVIFNNTVLIDS